MTERIRIEVEPWILEDGNYGDFSVGDDAWFALEFHGVLERRDPAEPRLHSRGLAAYDVTARTVLRTDGLWVIDWGTRAYCDVVMADGIRTGDW